MYKFPKLKHDNNNSLSKYSVKLSVFDNNMVRRKDEVDFLPPFLINNIHKLVASKKTLLTC
jgi:hypothetical protein